MRSERGQASLEWTAAVAIVAVAFGAALAFMPAPEGRSLGGFLAHRIVCAVKGGCGGQDRALVRAYGREGAALVRENAPNLVYEPGQFSLPVDPRRCRSHRCSDAPDDRDLDTHRSKRTGTPATAFTRLVRQGGETHIQYWLYYPDSNSTFTGSRRLWGLAQLDPRSRALSRAGAKVVTGDGSGTYPGFHKDDWESFQVRLDRSGHTWVRASSHDHYQWCKQRRCRNRWGPSTGWTRVSKGSHAGHVPERVQRERTTTAEGLRLVPLETYPTAGYRPLDEGVTPPWRKRVYRDPRSDSTG